MLKLYYFMSFIIIISSYTVISLLKVHDERQNYTKVLQQAYNIGDYEARLKLIQQFDELARNCSTGWHLYICADTDCRKIYVRCNQNFEP